jgi:hypothetical protein
MYRWTPRPIGSAIHRMIDHRGYTNILFKTRAELDASPVDVFLVDQKRVFMAAVEVVNKSQFSLAGPASHEPVALP